MMGKLEGIVTIIFQTDYFGKKWKLAKVPKLAQQRLQS